MSTPVPDRPAAPYAVDGTVGDYWRDRNLKFHEDKHKPPTKNVRALLDHIETSGGPNFWAQSPGDWRNRTDIGTVAPCLPD